MATIQQLLGTISFTTLTMLIVQPAALAQEITGTKASELPNVSYSASQLVNSNKPIKTNLSTFCKYYPQNASCIKKLAITEQSIQKAQLANKNNQKSGWAIAPQVSTLGLGGSIIRQISPKFNARLGIHGFSTSVDIIETNVDYEGDINLFNVPVAADYYPGGSGFKLSGGLVFNDNNATASVVGGTGQDITIGGQTFTLGNQLEGAEARVDFSSIAPYIGIGWGNPISDNPWTFNLDLGIMFIGSPNVDVTAQNVPSRFETAVNNAIAEEEKELEEEITDISVYPVATVGVSYRF